MIGQLFYGVSLEKEYKVPRFIALYFLSGIIGNMFSCIFHKESLSIGASSSIFGVN
jgi:membrane associated rhomboid family serine protease